MPLASQGVQAWDRYAGMNNNPVRWNDPSGHDVGCAGRDLSECAPKKDDDGGDGKPEWADDEDANVSVEGYGSFDMGHVRRGWRSAAHLDDKFNDDRIPMRSKGRLRDVYQLHYSVSDTVTPDQKPGVMLGIYMDFEIGYESYQGSGYQAPSSFAVADLPSDYLGFWAYVNGVPLDELWTVLARLGNVTRYSTGGQAMFDAFAFDIFSPGSGLWPLMVPVQNTQFSPMEPAFIPYGGDPSAYAIVHQNVFWPSWMNMTPIAGGPDTWQRVP